MKCDPNRYLPEQLIVKRDYFYQFAVTLLFSVKRELFLKRQFQSLLIMELGFDSLYSPPRA